MEPYKPGALSSLLSTKARDDAVWQPPSEIYTAAAAQRTEERKLARKNKRKAETAGVATSAKPAKRAKAQSVRFLPAFFDTRVRFDAPSHTQTLPRVAVDATCNSPSLAQSSHHLNATAHTPLQRTGDEH
jgi:hypothetical protein